LIAVSNILISGTWLWSALVGPGRSWPTLACRSPTSSSSVARGRRLPIHSQRRLHPHWLDWRSSLFAVNRQTPTPVPAHTSGGTRSPGGCAKIRLTGGARPPASSLGSALALERWRLADRASELAKSRYRGYYGFTRRRPIRHVEPEFRQSSTRVQPEFD